MESFVKHDSIVKKIWGTADMVLFIFAGAAAEFAVNKAVDWLYYTGKLPADPLGRLFSTVTYAQQIIFSNKEEALKAIYKITAIHQAVEQSRGQQIPDWAYRDVLYMLIDYSIRSFQLLNRKLTRAEKDEIYLVFYNVGKRMELKNLPPSYPEWELSRLKHLNEDLICSEFTVDLYKQYYKHLGKLRFMLLKQVQLLLIPEKVKRLLPTNKKVWLSPMLLFYRFSRYVKIDSLIKTVLLPKDYKEQIKALDIK